jgi:hypothetical protein
MPKPRKTLNVQQFKDSVNCFLASTSAHSTPERRIGAYVTLETALHQANAYKGWGLLTVPEIGQIFEPGKGWVIKDETRRFYY